MLRAEDELTLNEHRRFPDILAFTLNNPIRRFVEPPERLIQKLNISPSDVVVDFGCGTGFFTVPLARIASKTIAVDASSRMLERTASYAKKRGVEVEVIQSDGKQIRIEDERVDIVFLSHVFHEVEDRPRVLSEFLRIIKPAGRLAIVERTRGSTFLSGKFGPPVINAEEVTQEMKQTGFESHTTIAHGKDTIIIGKKSSVAQTP
jgi:ubiquinone/menaquinone biosynthesis C-methylase UbiE